MKHVLPFLFVLLIAMATSCSSSSAMEMEENILPKVTLLSGFIIEGAGNGILICEIKLSSPSTENVVISYKVEGVTAEAGVDFVLPDGTITIPSGQVSGNIEIEVLDDDIKELEEKIQVEIVSAQNAEVTTQLNFGIIRDDEIPVDNASDGYSTSTSHYGYDEVWADEFTDLIDQANYTYEIGGGCPICGWGNNESQLYTDSNEESFLRDGKLVIKANEVSPNTYHSARMITKDKKEFTFGRIDIRAKLPEGQGIWPALWMLGANIDDVGWPACGEIDIMELVGHQPFTSHGTAHWGPSGGGSTFRTGSKNISKKFSESFHVFTLLWEKNSLTWYLDEEKFHSIRAAEVAPSAYPFNNPFFFIFNVAVGGNWPGYPDETTTFPQEMEIDYIRVFQEI